MTAQEFTMIRKQLGLSQEALAPLTHCVNRPLCPACQAEYARRQRIRKAKKKRLDIQRKRV